MQHTYSTPLRLYLLELALIAGSTPAPGYLIQTSDGQNILIDTGIPSDGSFTPAGGHDLQIFSVIDKLAELGLQPSDIDILICSHFDPDHCGGHDLFPDAEFVVQRSHYEFALTSDLPRFSMTRTRWHRTNIKYRFVEGDTTLLPGITLIETSGHVPGHQAVLVHLPETGPVLLTIDAAALASDLDPETRLYESGVDLDPAQALASARKLFALVHQEQVKLVLFGHDDEQWPTLKKSPIYYA